MSDFIYSNITIAYTGSDPNGLSAVRGFVQSNTPILQRPSDYYCTITRFSLDTTTSPLIIPLIQLGQTDPNLTQYVVSLSYNGVYASNNVIYVPSDITQPIPNPPNVSLDVSSRYYYIYSYQGFLSMINTALATTLVDLNALTATGETVPPEFYYDPNYGIVLKCPQTYGQSYNTTPDNNLIQISVGSNLSVLFGYGFPYVTLVGNTSPAIHTIVLAGNGSSNVEINSVPYWVLPIQSPAELSAWCESVTYQIISTLPIQYEFSSVPDSAYGVPNTGGASQQSILTDFQVDSTNPVAYHAQLVYNQSNTLRMINMTSNDPLYRYDIVSVLFTDRYGRQFPLLLGANQNVSLKFSFVRRTVYSK